MKKYVIYLRVSTQKQGASGLGIEAQRKMCTEFIKQRNGELVNEFLDVESGTHRDRKGLWDAIEYCQVYDCALVIAKLDRLARDVEFTFKVINTGVEIHFTDMPMVNTMILGVFASVAQYERELISSRTKVALQAKIARGEKLGAASDKYRQGKATKTKEELEKEHAKRSSIVNANFLHSRDTQAFIKCLQKVFPNYCAGDVMEWSNWKEINTKGENKERMYSTMQDMRDLDPTGKVFSSWNFRDDGKKLQVKLASAIQTLRLSVANAKKYAEC